MKTKNLGKIVSKASGLGPRQIRAIISTEQADRVGDQLIASGVDLKGYRANPIVLAEHDRCSPIGIASQIDVKAGRIEALIDFAPEGASERADEYCALAKSGVLKGVSVGFVPKAQEPVKGGGYKIKAWELLEISLVAVPCNAEAVILQRSLGSRRGIFDGKTVSAKSTERARRLRMVDAMALKHAPAGATSLQERWSDIARLKSRGSAAATSSTPADYAAARAKELASRELAASAAAFTDLSPTVRQRDLDRLRRI